MPWTPADRAAMAAADVEIEATFVLTYEEVKASERRDLLAFFGNKRLLTVTDVSTYTGRDPRWVKTRFGFTAKTGISIPTLARKLAE